MANEPGALHYESSILLDGTVMRPLTVDVSKLTLGDVWAAAQSCGARVRGRLDAVESSDQRVLAISSQGPQGFTMTPVDQGSSRLTMTIAIVGVEGASQETNPEWLRETCRRMREGEYLVEASYEVTVDFPVQCMRLLGTQECSGGETELVMMAGHAHDVHVLTDRRRSPREPTPLNGYAGVWGFAADTPGDPLGIAALTLGLLELDAPPTALRGALLLPDGTTQRVRVIQPQDVDRVRVPLKSVYGGPFLGFVQVKQGYSEIAVGMPEFFTRDGVRVQHPGPLSPTLTVDTPDVCHLSERCREVGSPMNLYVEFSSPGLCAFTVAFPTLGVSETLTVRGDRRPPLNRTGRAAPTWDTTRTSGPDTKQRAQLVFSLAAQER